MKKILILLFVLLPAVLAVGILATPDRALSESENRSLQTKSSLSASVTDGRFQRELEQLLADQMPLRDAMMRLRFDASYALGARDLGGTYLLKNKRMVQKITTADVDADTVVASAKRVAKAAGQTPLYVMLIPSAEISLQDALPHGAPVYDYDALCRTLQDAYGDAVVMDVAESLQGREDAFYWTDHHWNATGAAAAYEVWCRAHGETPHSFEHRTVSERFRGTLYGRTPLHGAPYDTVMLPVVASDLRVTADGKTVDFYDMTALQSADQYRVFQGGNHGIVTIENGHCQNDKTLLIVKDSFANSFVPYLTEHYRKIIMLDERYMFVSLKEYVASLQPDEIAVVKEIIA